MMRAFDGGTVKKMPCLFQRDFTDLRNPVLLRDVTPGCEWVLAGEGVATIKRDGTACAIIGGRLFKRYDAKRGKPAPENGIPCDSPDPVTGHWPHWIPVGDEPGSKYHAEAWDVIQQAEAAEDGTYELCGPKFSANPEGLVAHHFIRHGSEVVQVPRDFDSLRTILADMRHEGIVFWREPGNVDAGLCKIRRADYGFEWPIKAVA